MGENNARVLEDLAGIMPEVAAKLTGETRRRVYNLRRVKVVVGVAGEVEVSGAIGDAVCIAGDQPWFTLKVIGNSSGGLRVAGLSSPNIT